MLSDFYRRPSRPVLAAGAALAAALLLAGCGNSSAPDDAATQPAAAISVSGAWSRETAPGQSTGGAFMTLANQGAASDRLMSGSTPVAREVQLHTMSMDNGVMRMRRVEDGLEIPAGGSVELKPGSYHIMLVGLDEPLTQGETVPLTLHFEKASDVLVDVAVQPITAEGPAEAHHG